MEDRMNALETALDTDLNAESSITDEFNLIENYFRDNSYKYYDYELPAIVFECRESDDVEPSIDNNEFPYERETVMALIVCQGGDYKVVKEKVKELISLVRDFLRSDQWRYRQFTKVGRSGFEISQVSEVGFKAVAGIEFTVDLETV